MTHQPDLDVLVAGAGPVGLLGALTLARGGRRVRVIDEEWRETARSYALALHPGSLELLAAAGLSAALDARGHRVDRVVYYGGRERRHEVSLARLASPFPYALVLPQQELEAALTQKLAELGSGEVSWSHRLAGFSQDAAGVDADVQRLGKASSGYAVAGTGWVVDEEWRQRSRLLIGADGHRSLVRRRLGLEFAQRGEASLHAVFEFAAAHGDRDQVSVVLDDDGTSVLWPLPGGRWRWSFPVREGQWLESPREKSRLALQLGTQTFHGVGEDLLAAQIEQRAPWFAAGAHDLRWSMVVRFERRLASAFGRDRAWLAGDAAHLGEPVAVRSMNVGLREVHDLAQRMERVLAGDDGALSGYDAERRAEWEGLLAAPTDALSGGWLDHNRERVLACLPASGTHLAQLAAQLG